MHTSKRVTGSALLAGCLLLPFRVGAQAAGVEPPSSVGALDERFLGYPRARALDDGANFGPWHVVFDGVNHGRGVFVSKGRLRLMPQVAREPSATNSTLVVSRARFGDADLELNATWTARQTTRIGVPNPWETGWLVWDYVDQDHFTYLVLKPNGWEVGRRDPSQPGTQRFITDAGAPVTPIGKTRKVTVRRSGELTAITVDGAPLTSFSLPAEERHGSVGMYSEDAVVDWTSFQVVIPPLTASPWQS